MEYPNIILLTKEDSYLFHQKSFKPFKNRGAYSILKNKLCQTHRDGLLIISQDQKFLKYVIKILRKKGINNLTIIIDDVFRAKHRLDHVPTLSTYTLESDFSNTILEEVEIIKQIIKNSKLKSHKIYHCEKIPQHIQKKIGFNVPIQYYDLFLTEWSALNRFSLSFSDNFNYKISCFNRRFDYHRQIIASLLYKEKDSLVTLCEKSSLEDILQNKDIPISDFEPKLRKSILKSLSHLDKEKLRIFEEGNIILTDDVDYAAPHKVNQNTDKIVHSIHNGFANIISETRFNSPFNYISEKSLKPIQARRPFIMLGPAGNLKMMQDFGFQTFDRWWDESYDSEPNPNKRFEMVYEIVKRILSKDSEQLKYQLKEMEPVLKHNKRILKKLPHKLMSYIGIDLSQEVFPEIFD